MTDVHKKDATALPVGFKLDEYFPYKMTVLSERVSLFLAEYYKGLGITIPQWRVLTVIATHHRTSPMAISQMIFMDKSRVTRAVDKLVEAGLAVRKTNRKDKRALILELTNKGKRLFKQISEQAFQIQLRLDNALTRVEREHFKTSLIKLDDELNQMEAELKIEKPNS